jgi:sulfide dehydrogenase [flavocytochrome c] flavoprotein subunit
VVDIFATRDSAQSYLPKSGYAAYSQGKVVAKLINARLKGKKAGRGIHANGMLRHGK